MYWFIGIIVFLLAVLAAGGWFFSTRILQPVTHSSEYAYQHEVEQGRFDPDWYHTLEREKVIIRSPWGYDLNGLFFSKNGSREVVIISHGITWNLNTSIKYMGMFLRRGYSVLLYDNRNHGENDKLNTTFGFYEKADLTACMNWVESRCGSGTLIGLMGESLGAGITLLVAAHDPRTRFAVADCPYSDLMSLLALRAQVDYHLPPRLLLPVADFFVFLRAGFHLRQVSPIHELAGVTIPILFAHGDQDTYIPPQMSVTMYRQDPFHRRLYLAPGAGHAQAYWMDPAAYEAYLDTFLKELVYQGGEPAGLSHTVGD